MMEVFFDPTSVVDQQFEELMRKDSKPKSREQWDNEKDKKNKKRVVSFYQMHRPYDAFGIHMT